MVQTAEATAINGHTSTAQVCLCVLMVDGIQPHDMCSVLWWAYTCIYPCVHTTKNTHTHPNTPPPPNQSIYKEAMHTYQQACSCSNAQLGDDLPSLLHNWGLGLLSMAQHLSGEGPGKEGTLDTLELQGVLDEAVTVCVLLCGMM